MLLTDLNNVCDELKLAYYYGSQNEFNVMALNHTEAKGTAVFFEGYLNQPFSVDGQGQLDKTDNAIIWVLKHSTLADDSPTRLQNIEAAGKTFERILAKLCNSYEITNGVIGGVKNYTNTGFDGVRVTLNAKATFPDLEVNNC